MAVNVNVKVAFDSNTHKFTFSGGNTPADDGTADFEPGGGNTVTYEPVDNLDIWFLTGVFWTPDDGVLDWVWQNDVVNGSIVVSDKEGVPVDKAVEYAVTLRIEEVATTQRVSGGPVIIDRPPDGTEQLKMSASR